MIYLIGGAPRVGKSIIAKHLAKSISGRFYSTDRLVKKGSNTSVIFYNDPKKNILTPSERIEVVIKESKQIISDINDIIDKAIKNYEDIIIEGVHLYPDYVADIIKKFGEKNIKSVFIGSTDIELILKGMEENTGQNNWPKDFNEDVLRQISLFVKAFSNYLYKESKKYNLFYKERSNDFKKDIHEIIKEFN